MFVIQITGAREWTDEEAIYNLVKPYVDQYGARNVILRHGKAKGADSLSHKVARRLGIPEDKIQARPVEFYGYSWDLDKDGFAAGNLRNLAMLEEKPTPNVVLAFPLKDHGGTVNMMNFALLRSIEVIVQGRKAE